MEWGESCIFPAAMVAIASLGLSWVSKEARYEGTMEKRRHDWIKYVYKVTFDTI
jgi:hypothetical protein